MPLRVTSQIEPLTSASQETPPVLAISKEYFRLYRDLERYTKGQISGRSYLVAGHRGSGKTMLVHKAIEDLLQDSKELPSRPLFVRLHGPDLLPPLSTKLEQAPGKKKSKKSKVEAADQSASNGGHAKTDPEDPPEPTPKNDSNSETELTTVLTQMMKCLFRDVTNEFRRCYRLSIVRMKPSLKREELLEIAGQFDLELTESLTAARLRSFWNRIGAMKTGILFTIPRTKFEPSLPPDSAVIDLSTTDAGIQEILVLTFLGQAFQVISGKVEEKRKQSELAKSEISSSLSTAYALKNLLAPIAGLVSGGVVGTQVALSGTNPIAAVLLGLLTGAVVSLTMSYSSSRSKNKEMSLESVFIKDRSVPTLSGVLPLLVQRLRWIGLAPVFVVDELDKVEDLDIRMEKLVQHLKYLITENSFSCFLTDRRYLNDLNRKATEIAYAAEYTYFSDRLLVLYRPSELRTFVENVIDSTSADPLKPVDATQNVINPVQDREDKTRIAYVVLHRARLHPIDLRRQIDRLAAELSFTFAEMFPEPGYQFEVLMQVAIEWLLNGEDVQTQLSANPDSRQVVYDSLYYVSRLWEDASNSEAQHVPGFQDFSNNNERKPGFVLSKKSLIEYLESRVRNPSNGKPVIEEQAPALKAERLSGADFDFLFTKVNELVDLLADPNELISEINTSLRMDKPPSFIINDIPRELLLEHREGTPNYIWLYDISGRYLRTRGVNTIIADVRGAISRIEQLNTDLETYGLGAGPAGTGGLQTMSNLGVLPRFNWRVLKSSIDRLQRMMSDPRRTPYGRMIADRDQVTQFARTLDEFEANLKAALLLAAALAPEVPTLLPRADGTPAMPLIPIYEMLVRSSQYLQLTASHDDDLRKINGILNSQNSNVPINSEDPWLDVSTFVKTAMTRPPFDQTIIESAWNLIKTRLSQHFRDGALVFEPQIEDIVTAIKGIEPGRSMPTDLSTMTAPQWTSILLRALLAPAGGSIPPMRVAAALALGLFDLAERLVAWVPVDAKLAEQWVRDAKLRNTQPQGERRNVLVIRAEQRSLCEQWKPSQKRGALIGTARELTDIVSSLKQVGVNRPADIPIDIVCLELTGDRATVGRLASTPPITVLSEMNPGQLTQDLAPFVGFPIIYYFAANAPQVATGEPRTANPFVLSPKSLDDLVEHLPEPQKAKSS